MEPRIQYAKTKDGVSIALWTLGEGPPFVCLPPAIFGHLQLEWQDYAFRHWYERLAEKRKLVRYDLRGTGLSERDVADFSLEALVSDIEAVADRLELESFDIYAFGAGTRTAIAYAVRHPQRVSHLILSRGFARARDSDVQKVEELLERDWELFTETFAHVLVGWSKGELAHRWAQLMRDSITHDVYKRAYPQLMEHDVTALLPQVRSPTLVLDGPPRLYRELASGVPDARLVILEEPSSIEGELDAVLRAIDDFLGEGETVAQPVERVAGGLVTILFTDIEGSTALAQRLGDARAQDVRRAHNAIVRDALRAEGGSEIKHTGDGIMASFPSASHALACAVAIQGAVAALRQAQDEQVEASLRVRIGLNAGEPVVEEDDLFGTSVDLAKRICDQAESGEILVSDVVRQLAAGKDFLFSDRGEVVPKGFDEAVRLYTVRWEEPS